MGIAASCKQLGPSFTIEFLRRQPFSEKRCTHFAAYLFPE